MLLKANKATAVSPASLRCAAEQAGSGESGVRIVHVLSYIEPLSHLLYQLHLSSRLIGKLFRLLSVYEVHQTIGQETLVIRLHFGTLRCHAFVCKIHTMLCQPGLNQLLLNVPSSLLASVTRRFVWRAQGI